MLKVKDVDYLHDYCLALLFSDGVKKEVNLEPYLKGEVFGTLRDKSQFIQYGRLHQPLNGPTVLIWHPNFYIASEILSNSPQILKGYIRKEVCLCTDIPLLL